MSRTNAVLLAWLVTGGIAAAQSLEERVKALELKIEEQGGAAAPEPGSPAAQALGKKIDVFFAEGIKFKSADGNLDAHLGGRVVVHYRGFQYHNERVQRDGFTFRQVKLHLAGKLWKDWEFKVELNTTGASVALDDGYVGLVRWKFLQIRVGQFKAPFSLEELTSTRFIDLPERSPMNRLTPARELGIMVHGEIVEKIFGYGLMASNGNGRNGPDENSDKDLTLRVWVRPLGTNESEWIKNLHFAFNGSVGRRDQAANTAPYTFSDPMTGTTFASLGGDAPSVKFDEDRYRYGGEFAWLFGPGSIKAEYIRTTDQYTNLDGFKDHSHMHFTAYYASATWLVTGETKTWDRIRPDKPLFGSGGGFGAIEIAARYSEFQINKEEMDSGYFNRGTSARRVREYCAGVNWFPNMNTRITVAYAYINYWGEEHTEPLVVSGKRIDHEDVLLVRVQIDF
jgi:phosphate-selective porin OprO/OprP